MHNRDHTSTGRERPAGNAASRGDHSPASPSPAGFEAPAISLPRGGGAIRGIDEKVSVNPVTGSVTQSIPLFTSPGRSGFAPSLAISYDSSNGNGPFGLGWSLSVPSIRRKTARGVPKYRDEEQSDTFVLSGAEDLVPVLRESAGGAWEPELFEATLEAKAFLVRRYRPRIEGLFARIERWEERSSGDVHWRATAPDNVLSIYGRSPAARIADPADERRVFEWLLEESADDRGNAILYEYKQEDESGVDPALPHEINRLASGMSAAHRYLKRVRYGNVTPFTRDRFLFEVVFDYGEHDDERPDPDIESRAWPRRLDPFADHRAGFEIRTRRLCRRVLMFHRFPELGPTPCMVRSTDLAYEETPFATYLTAVVQRGYIRDEAGNYQSKSFPPVEFSYSKPTIDERVRFMDPLSFENLPQGLDESFYQWVDLDGEGLSGVLSQTGGAWYYKRNLGGGRLAGLERVVTQPSIAAEGSSSVQLLDLGGDGNLDLALFSDGMSGYFSRTEDAGWERHQLFESLPRVDWSDPNLRLIDLSGDGHADVLLTEDDIFVVYESLAKEGFAPARNVRKAFDEEVGPALVFSDGTESVYLADMSGDGLVDIVRIRNGEICYWPSLGYGRFGAKVTMDRPPLFDHPALFEQKRIRLADIDGTGPTDIVYLGRAAATIWFNESGNGWSGPHRIDSYPPVDDVSSVFVIDLLGTGTACLVWSSPLHADREVPMRYIDLLSAGKPHLLVSVRNNLGAETRLAYASSTKFYLEDRAAGTPWISRLPFPVHVVERVETYDAVSRARFVSTYRYRHGYFDGHEREFRGFGYVEQRDAESFDASSGRGLFPDVVTTNMDEEFRLAPVVTKSWFHTGAWLGRDRISRRYAGEYYDESQHHAGSAAPQFPDTVLPDGITGASAMELTPEEEREACRALKGLALRSEVYAEDGTDRAIHPYRVTETNYSIRWLQPERPNQHAVFFTHPRSSLDFYYERNPADPRVQHALTMEVDDWGNVTRSAAIGYRRRGDGHLPEQSTSLIVLTEGDFFNSPHTFPGERGWYRTGVPVETRSWELTGVDVDGHSPISIEDLAHLVATAVEIGYEAEATPGVVEKRLLERSRTLCSDNAQSGPLPLGELQSLALPWKSFQLAFTEGLVSSVYGDRVTAAMLEAEGRYVRENATRGHDGAPLDGTWWIPSGRQVLDATRFYLPVTAIDPFGAEYAIEYDAHDLFAARISDPLLNTSSARHDYRVLSPDLVTDPNGNSQGITLDELGMVTATIVMGRKGEGDSWSDPTTRLEYDLHRFMNTRKDPGGALPVFVRALARERHADPSTPWQESYGYSDGSGRVVMVKVQAEPDGAGHPRWVGNGRTVVDNKGNPVKQYEPYFSTTPEFEDEDEIVHQGVTPILRYDALGRLIRTDLPNGTYSRVEFDPWQSRSFDANDGVADSAWFAARKGASPTITTVEEVRAADLASAHRDTPTVSRLDVLGRRVRMIADNGAGGSYETRIALDVEGQQREVVDARGNHALDQVFDVAGRVVHTRSADAGERWLFPDIAGKPIRAWDGRGHARRQLHDALQRPTELRVAAGNEPELLTHLIVYGEGHSEAARNLRGRPYKQYDGAGVLISETFDFKGNRLAASRRLAVVYEQTPDWLPLSGVAIADLDAIEQSHGLLQAEAFTTSTAYDALNRPFTIRLPDSTAIELGYNEANLLERVDATLRGSSQSTPFVSGIDYNEKGQRERILYGNGTETFSSRDPLTFRLVRLLTLRRGEGAVLQDLRYTHDPAGNITEIGDSARQTVFFANQAVEPRAAYVYDALYRLIEATGREHGGQTGTQQQDHGDIPLSPLPHPNDGQSLRRYREHYAYDAVGNILEMVHRLEGPSGGPLTPSDWRRVYQYAVNSNRLLAHSMPGDAPNGPFSGTFEHDAHGNMTRMPHLAKIDWNHDDEMQHVDLGGGGHAYYAYDATGERVRKVWRHNGLTEERIYLGGFEVYRRHFGGSLDIERRTIHVMAGEQRVAIVETQTVDDGNAVASLSPRIRYQLGNHLGSASLEVDETGGVISYEEYHPYGTTAYHSSPANVDVSAKRYRYTGEEKDEVTGLYYHGARYYACWLARWTAADPDGMVDGICLYAYVRGSPICLRDPGGTQSVGSIDDQIAAERADWENRKGWGAKLGAKEYKEHNRRINELRQRAQAEALKWVASDAGQRASAKAYAGEGSRPAAGTTGAAAEQYSPGQGEYLTAGPQSREQVEAAARERDEGAYREKHPTAASQNAAEMGFIARVDPSGGGVIGGAVYGASLLAGSTPEQAAFDAKLAETLLQAIIIGRGVKVSGDYMPQIEGPPAIPETVATPGGPNVGAPQPGGVAVYRGVHGKHPDLPNARRGKANPWGGSSTPEEHSNDGFVDSEFTSWTTDPGVAEFFARQRGPGGVILHDIIEPSEGHVTPLEKFQEYEILRRGPIRGVWVRRLK
jgi:RHS repeat-associated protein